MIRCVVSGPVDCYAGYGQRALDLVKALIRVRPDWDIQVISQRWGECRFGYLEDHNEWEVMSRITNQLNYSPDVWIQVTVPNEFRRVGKVNIGVTAAIETTTAPASWIEGCNRMDLVITSSSHGKRSLVDPAYKNTQTGQDLKLNPNKVQILFEGVNKDIYYQTTGLKFKRLTDLRTNWNFLYVGHWLPGYLGEDRKNTGYTIKMFLETFKDIPNPPGLIIKTSRASATIVDQDEIIDVIQRIREQVKFKSNLPPVYLLHGDLTSEEMNQLYNDPRIKAMVSFTKGEGFGRPLLEFASIGKPILVSGWSGHMDFLSSKHTAFVGGTLEKVHPSAANDMILKEAMWFKPDDNQVRQGFQTLYTNYAGWKVGAEDQRRIIANNFTLDKMAEKLDNILTNLIDESGE